MQIPEISAQQLDVLFESFPECLCVFDTKFQFSKVNSALCQLSGYSETELTSQPFINFIHPDDQYNTLMSLQKMEIGEMPEVVENRFLVKESHYKWLSWNCFMSDQKGLVHCSVRDLSESKELEARLQRTIQENKKLSNSLGARRAEEEHILFSNNPLPMWAYDIDRLKILMVNESALSLYGYTREEFLNLNLYDLRPETEHERLKRELTCGKIYKDIKYTGEWQHLKKNGSIIYVDTISQKLKVNDQNARLIVINNITAGRKAQIKLVSQNIRLREIAQLSSHDLRGPVASILGLVSLFDDKNIDINLNNQIIENLKVSAKDLDKVIHEIVRKTYCQDKQELDLKSP